MCSLINTERERERERHTYQPKNDSIWCDQTPPGTIAPHPIGLAGKPSERYPAHALDPYSGNFRPKRTVYTEHTTAVGNRRQRGAYARYPDGTTLAKMLLSTEMALRQEHRTPFARSLRHALRIFCQVPSALHVAPVSCPYNAALITSPERATTLRHITPALLKLSDGCCSRLGRYNEHIKDNEWTPSTGRSCLQGEVGKNHETIHLKLANCE